MPERVTEKWRANRHHRKPEGSAARMIRGGLVGPKVLASASDRWTTGRHSRTTAESFDQCRMLMGNCRGETCAVQAGREPRVSPRGADREASASGGGDTHRKGRAPTQSRNAGSGDSGYPYRKPTQVGWLSKLRWTSDPGLRNSAIYSRTFGRRETVGGDLSCRVSARQ